MITLSFSDLLSDHQNASYVVAPFWSVLTAELTQFSTTVFDAVTDNDTISEVSSYISQAVNSQLQWCVDAGS